MSKPRIVLYASEIGACCGLNPYKPPYEAMETVWQRVDAESFSQCTKRMEGDGKTRSQRIRGALVERMPELVSEAERAGDTVKDSTDLKCRSAVVAKAAKESGCTGEEIGHLESLINCKFGTRKEDEVVKSNRIRNNNGRFRMVKGGRVKTDRTSYSWLIGGRSDGFSNGELVEIKNRKNRFMLPQYDMAQICAYMRIYQVESCLLIQRLGEAEEKTRIRDTGFWDETVLPRLQEFVRRLCVLLESRDMQERFMRDPKTGFSGLG